MWALRSRTTSQCVKAIRRQLRHVRVGTRKRRHNVNVLQRARLLSIQPVVELFNTRIISGYHSTPISDDFDSTNTPQSSIHLYDFHNQVAALKISRRERIMDALRSNPKVRMRDPAVVEQKLKLLVEGGLDKLMVISDFDYTLSRFHDASGMKCWTTHGVFDSASAVVSSDLGKKVASLKAKYLPIEFDPHMSIAEKTPLMEKWWRSAHQHIVNAKFTYQAIERFVEASKIELRDEADEMILDLSENDVPLIIFSAGIGNVIDIYLKKRLGKKPRNVHLISNMMDFDELGVVNGFREPLIHTFCKNGSVIGRKRSFYSDVALRTNVLLMGDSLGDLNMDVGVEGETVALKIGFLNFNVDSLLENFLNGYDIVLIDDQSMNVARNIIEMVSQTKHIHTNSHTYAIADHTAVGSTTSCRIEAANEEDRHVQSEADKSHAVTTDVKA